MLLISGKQGLAMELGCCGDLQLLGELCVAATQAALLWYLRPDVQRHILEVPQSLLLVLPVHHSLCSEFHDCEYVLKITFEIFLTSRYKRYLGLTKLQSFCVLHAQDMKLLSVMIPNFQ